MVYHQQQHSDIPQHTPFPCDLFGEFRKSSIFNKAWVWERIPGEIFDNVGGTNSLPATHDQLVLGQNGSILNLPTHAGGGGALR